MCCGVSVMFLLPAGMYSPPALPVGLILTIKHKTQIPTVSYSHNHFTGFHNVLPLTISIFNVMITHDYAHVFLLCGAFLVC